MGSVSKEKKLLRTKSSDKMSCFFQSVLQIATRRMAPQIKADNNIDKSDLIMILILIMFIRVATY